MENLMIDREAIKLIKDKYPNAARIFVGMGDLYCCYYEDNTHSREIAKLFYPGPSCPPLPNGSYQTDKWVSLQLL